MSLEFKGTQGVWEINKRASRNVRCNGITIANCSSGQSGDIEEEEIANAKLISCAPKLLSSLMTAINLLKQTTEFDVLVRYRLEVLELEKTIEKALT